MVSQLPIWVPFKNGRDMKRTSGEFHSGSITGNTDQNRINMMPFAAITYIIKTLMAPSLWASCLIKIQDCET